MSSGDIGASQVEFGAFVRDWSFSVALMEAAIAIGKDEFGPVGKLTSGGVSGGHALRDE